MKNNFAKAINQDHNIYMEVCTLIKQIKYLTLFSTLTLSIVAVSIHEASAQYYEYSGEPENYKGNNRYSLDRSLRTKSNTGWKVDKSVRQKKKTSQKRWSIDESVRRNDTNSGFNYNPTDVSRD